MLHEGSTHVTLMLSIVVAPEKMARYEAWLSEAEAILRRHDGFLSMDIIKPRSHIEPEYIILQRFRTPEALEAWRSSDDLAEIRRQASAFVLAAQEGERALGLDMMFERPQTGHLYPKPAIYKQILIAIMTFVLITSSGTMALAVNYGYRRDKKMTAIFIGLTALFGATFVGMQAFEWTKLIHEGVRPWGNPWGAPQFGSSFFMITGFHGMHVSAGVIYLLWVAVRVLRGRYDEKGYEIVEIAGLYWHFVDLVRAVIFAFFYLW